MADGKEKLFKRSHRDINLYFEGYQKQKSLDPVTGRSRTEYIYAGDYYIFRLEQREYNRFRAESAAAIIGALVLYVVANVLGPQGGATLYVGIPALCAIIPMLYMILGLSGLRSAKTPKMTIREYTFGLGRLKNTTWAVVGLWGLSLLGELVYIIIHRAFQAGELCSALLQAAGVALLVWQMVRQERVLSTCIHKANSRFENMDGTEKTEGAEQNGR